MAGATGKGAYAMMIVGRIIAGFGNAIISTSVPLYQRFGEIEALDGVWLTGLAVKSPPQRREADSS